MLRVLNTWKRRFLLFTYQSDAGTPVLGTRIPSLVDELHDANDASISVISMQNFGNNNQLHVGDDNRDNKGIIVTGGNVQLYARGPLTFQSIKLSPTTTAIIYIKATEAFIGALFGGAINDPEGKPTEDHLSSLVEAIKSIVELEVVDPSAPQVTVRGYLRDLQSELCLACKPSYNADDNSVHVETYRLGIAWTLRLFLFVSHMGGYVPLAIMVDRVKKRIVEMQRDAEAAAPVIKGLPRTMTAYNDYVSSHHRRISCFEGTRQALLEEVGRWVAESETGIFVLFGLAGIGKSTIAQTVAERADDVRLLGASFFFSRDEAERNTAKRFFTTIAFQLCVHDPEFATAIESILMTEQGKDAVSKSPLEQLEALILEPLQKLTPRKVVIVIDALDECDDEDAPAVLMGLNKLVQGLPSFKVILTTRPQQHLQQLLQTSHESQKIFHMHNIEDKIVDGDIELYLRHKLSLEEVRVRLPNLRKPWAASDDEIKSLVHAAGRLFIIASTAVLFILDKTSTPAYRMKVLRTALDWGHTPFNTLNNFYTTILRNAVPKGCERDTVDRYQTVISSIILIQEPLSISNLATLVNIEVDDIIAVLGNLQPVILLGGNDIPVVYHKSFPEYIQDPARCTDEDLRIDPRFHHTQIAIHCLRLLNGCLKQNILDIGGSARFIDNDEALEKQGLAWSYVQEKIPSELRYACSYFANHVQSTNEDADLAQELEQFVNERLLNWLEVLSWIEKLDSAHRTLLTVQQHLRTSPHLCQLVEDGLRFLGNFYDLIKQSALRIYYAALPFTPTETSLYIGYSKQMKFCRLQGGRKTWDGLIAAVNSGSRETIQSITFSSNGTMFACTTESLMTVYDAISGMPLGRIEGTEFTIAHDFSRMAVFNDGLITLYNVEGVAPVATIKPSATVVKLGLSSNGSRLLAMYRGSVGLWDTQKYEEIKRFNTAPGSKSIVFSTVGSLAAFVAFQSVTLLDGMNGKIIANMSFERLESLRWWTLMFSGDGSRFACLVAHKGISPTMSFLPHSTLEIRNCRNGGLIGRAEDVGYRMTISTDGSLLVTCDGEERQLKLWSGNDLALLSILDLDFSIKSLTTHNNLLGIASSDNHVALYDIKCRSFKFVTRLPFTKPVSLAFSPDCTRLAAGNGSSDVRLWDISSITASNNSSREQSSRPTALAFSPDCSLLASGYEGGSIKLWDTSSMAQIAAHQGHSERVTALAFSADGRKFASGSEDEVVRLWNGKDCVPGGILECPDKPTTVALSSSILAAAMKAGITLWDLMTHSFIAILSQDAYVDTELLAFSHHHSLLATATVKIVDQTPRYTLELWDIAKLTLVFKIDLDSSASRMRFLPDDSQLAVQCWDHSFHLFNPHDGKQSRVSENQAISQLGLCPSWHGIPVWNLKRWTVGGCGVVGRFLQQEVVIVLHYPSDLRVAMTADGSSIIALGCEDGHILLLRAV